jgi:hypothetical protein
MNIVFAETFVEEEGDGDDVGDEESCYVDGHYCVECRR